MVNMTRSPSLQEEFAPLWQTEKVEAAHAKKPAVLVPPYPFHGAGSKQFSAVQMWAFIAAAPAVPLVLLSISLKWYPVSLLALGLPAFAFYIVTSSSFLRPPQQAVKLPGKPLTHYITFRDEDFKRQYGNAAKIPMETLAEAYFDEKIDFNGDMYEILEQRYDFADFKFEPTHIKFFLTQWIPELLMHTKAQDEDQVREHYDRGNDFYAAFLGPRMVYTSGLVSDPSKRESLEQLQDNKLDWICRHMDMKPGDRHLDIGCGWGTLLTYAAKHYGTDSTGVTLAENQCEFGLRRAEEHGVADRVHFLNKDYRDIPKQKFDKITCVEMAEHVGVRLFPNFMQQCMDLLEDDGLLYLQIAGLRRPWTFEDLIWGLFMAKYIFPGADASCPLNWVINQLETAGFEVREVQTIGVHYSATLDRWYRNWMSNKDVMTERYGVRWTRVWELFLAWSSIIARQGSATCYQIVAHKNRNSFSRAGIITPSTPVTGKGL